MNLKINTLITLKDNKKYIIINDTELDGNRYLALVGVLEDESNVNNEYLIAKEEIDGEDVYVTDVTDEELINKLLPLLKIEEE